MVDLHGQYLRFKEEIDEAMQVVIDSCAFINGPQVKTFAGHLADYLQVPYVIPCANGTDALQIALMALELQPGDKVIPNIVGVDIGCGMLVQPFICNNPIDFHALNEYILRSSSFSIVLLVPA